MTCLILHSLLMQKRKGSRKQKVNSRPQGAIFNPVEPKPCRVLFSISFRCETSINHAYSIWWGVSWKYLSRKFCGYSLAVTWFDVFLESAIWFLRVTASQITGFIYVHILVDACVDFLSFSVSCSINLWNNLVCKIFPYVLKLKFLIAAEVWLQQLRRSSVCKGHPNLCNQPSSW